MKKMKSLITVIILVMAFVGCSKTVNGPSSDVVPTAGVYYIPATVSLQVPQVLISDGQNVWSGNQAVGVVKSFKVVDGNTLEVVLDNGSSDFYLTGTRIPITPEEYGAPDTNHPFNGLYAAVLQPAFENYIVAVTSDSAVILTEGAPGYWTREKVSVSNQVGVSGHVLQMPDAGTILGYNPLTPNTPPSESHLCQLYKGTGGQTTLQLVALDYR